MNKRIKQVSILLIIYGVLPLGFTTLYFIGNLYSFLAIFEPYNLSMVAGALAYITFMNQFILSSRLGLLEKFIPQDRLLYIHGIMGILTAALVFSHFIIKYLIVLRFGTLMFQSLLGIFALLIYASIGPASLLVLRGRTRKKDSSPAYEKTRKVHNMFALAGLVTLIHVFLASSTWTLALKIFTLSWGVFALGTYVFHKIIRPYRAAPLEVSEVTHCAPGVYTYSFNTIEPDKLKARKSGQFGYFCFKSEVVGNECHPFTISSSASSEIETVIRASGDFTRGLKDVPIGTKVRFDGPYGHFNPEDFKQGTCVIMLAGGIGITPFMSMLRDDDLRSKYKMNLVWSVRTPDDINVLSSIVKTDEQDDFSSRFIYTRTAPEGESTGRLNKTILTELMHKYPLKETVWFICGPPEFSSSMRKMLKDLKIRPQRIRVERFSW